MSVLRSLALTLATTALPLLLPKSQLYAQTSTPRTGTAKPKATAPQKRSDTPARRNPAPGPADISAPAAEGDSWSRLSPPPVNAQGYRPYQQAGLIAVVNYFGSGVGTEYLYSYSPRLTLGGSFMHTNADLKDDAADGATEFLTAESNSLRLYARYSIFWFLYGGAGLNFDSIKGDYGWKGAAVNGNEIKTTYNARIAAFDVFFGSEWKGLWSTYFGVDWLGLAVPLVGTIEYNANEAVEVTSKALKGKMPNQRLDEETSAQLRIYYLNLKAGIVF